MYEYADDFTIITNKIITNIVWGIFERVSGEYNEKSYHMCRSHILELEGKGI